MIYDSFGSICYSGIRWTLLGVVTSREFEMMPMLPVAIPTYFRASHAVVDGRLCLAQVHFHAEPGTKLPPIGGAKPRWRTPNPEDPLETALGNVHYEDVNLPIGLTGGMLLGNSRTSLPSAYGPWLPWCWEQVRELIFEGGVLTETLDHSTAMTQLRERVAQHEGVIPVEFPGQPPYEALENLIFQNFRLDYRSERESESEH